MLLLRLNFIYMFKIKNHFGTPFPKLDYIYIYIQKLKTKLK